MNYLLDTCVISEFTRKRPEPRLIAWLEGVPEDALHLSAITIGELQRGIEKLPESQRKAALLLWLNESLLPRFGPRILPLDAVTLLRWGSLTARQERAGRPMSVMDGLISATTLQHGLVLVTRNTSDFETCGVQLINPWA